MKLLIWVSILCLGLNARALDFSRACESKGKDLIIAAVGDLLMHQGVQTVGYKYGLDATWRGVAHFLSAADLTYANLETPLAAGVLKDGSAVKDPGPVFDDRVYSAFPQFNAHPVLAEDIANTFDVVSTANNHSLDRGALGVNKTIDALGAVNLSYTGTIKAGADRQWHTVVRKAGWNIAFVSCTFSTNGIKDPYNQVLGCYKNKKELLGVVSSLSKQKNIDAVIVTPHWGNEYADSPSSTDVSLGRELLEYGATAVLGTHPHVIQTWERYVTKAGREGLIVYSTGNFISQQFFKNRIKTRLGLIVYLGLSKKGNNVWINGARYTPIWLEASPFGVLPLERSTAPNAMAEHAHRLLGHEDRLYGGERLITNHRCR